MKEEIESSADMMVTRNNIKVWLGKTTRPTLSSKLLCDALSSTGIITVGCREDTEKKISSLLQTFVYSVSKGVTVIYVNRDKNWYAKDVIKDGRRIKPRFGYKVLMKTLTYLEGAGYIKLCKGFNIGRKKEDGYLILTEDFVTIIKSCTIDKDKNVKEEMSSVVLKDVDGTPKTFSRKTWSNKIESVRSYNSFIGEFEITLDDDEAGEIELTPWLCRIFKENFKKHGRIYNTGEIINYQTLPQSDRNKIRINGMETCEVDFKHLHPSILYAMEGKEVPGDVYSVGADYSEVFEMPNGNYPEEIIAIRGGRNAVKGAMLRVLNTSSRSACIQSVVKMFKEDSEKEEHLRKYPTTIQDKKKAAENLIKSIEEEHSAIKDYFYSEQSLMLMATDSEILMYILSECQEEGILVLPVHDSLVCAKRYVKLVKEIMFDGYEAIMGTRLNCFVEVK